MRSIVVLLFALPLLAEAKSKLKCQGIVWYHDERINMCLAKHCCKVKKDDIFTTADYRTCSGHMLMDFFTCGGGMDAKDLRNCQHPLQKAPPPPGSYVEPTTTTAPAPLCPAGEFCLWGPFGFGFCCDEKNEEVWRANYAAKCPPKMRTVNITQPDVTDEVLRGKSCKDHFCPRGSKCVQGKYLAHCCI